MESFDKLLRSQGYVPTELVHPCEIRKKAGNLELDRVRSAIKNYTIIAAELVPETAEELGQAEGVNPTINRVIYIRR